MKSFYTIAIVGLLLASVPMEGAWQRWAETVKQKLSLPQQLSYKTKVAIVLFSWTTLVQYMVLPEILDWSAMIAASSMPDVTRAAVLLNGIIIPVSFLNSLKNNPDFWNREGLENKFFLYSCMTTTMASILGLWQSLYS